MVGQKQVALCRIEGYRYICAPSTTKEGDPFDLLHLVALSHNGWDGFVWGFEASLLVDLGFPNSHTPHKTPTCYGAVCIVGNGPYVLKTPHSVPKRNGRKNGIMIIRTKTTNTFISTLPYGRV